MSHETTFSRLLRRSIQLDAIAYVLIAGLLVLAAILAFMVFNSITPPEGWLFGGEYFQLVGLALVCVLVFYLLEQHGRLRRMLVSSHEQLEQAQLEIERACKGLTTAHHAAEIMTSVVDDEALSHVVCSIRDDFGVDAVAIVGDEVIVSCASGIESDTVSASVTRVAAEAVRTAAPIAAANDEDGSFALAVPLRVMGKLHGVLCMWRQHGRMSAEELEGLELIARVLELGWESQILYTGVNRQLAGIVTVVSNLIDQRMPGYARQTQRISVLAQEVGDEIGIGPDEAAEMRVAVELRDLGVLYDEETDTIFGTHSERRATANHPLSGARLAELGNFSEQVRRSILCHHECPDGSGYPMRLTAASIPLSASIIHACETFVELAQTGKDPALNQAQALRVMNQGAEKTFDARVVEALTRVVTSREREGSSAPAESSSSVPSLVVVA